MKKGYLRPNLLISSTEAHPVWLLKRAKMARRSLKTRVNQTPVDYILLDLYQQTVTNKDSEVNKQWANGPFTEKQMVDRHGPLHLPCGRFGVDQANKIRPIDDFSEYFVNACTTCKDKISVAGVDAITGFIKMWADKILEGTRNPDHAFSITMDDGSVKHGILHEACRSRKKAGRQVR